MSLTSADQERLVRRLNREPVPSGLAALIVGALAGAPFWIVVGAVVFG